MTRIVTLALAALAIVACAVIDWPHFLRGYLIGWLLALAVAGGAMGWLMIHALTGGRWGDALRPAATLAARTMPIVAVAFVPIAIGAGHLFTWADASLVEASHALQHRRVAFAPPLVIGRSLAFLAAWSLLASITTRASDTWRGRLAAGGLVFYFVTMSLAIVDWIASREPDWYSSTFGLVTILGQAVTALAVTIAAVCLRRRGRAISPDIAHDLANLLQTSVVLWAYVSFMQYLVIWSGNTQEDIVWFVHRTRGPWLVASIALMVGHFGLPFMMLLFQRAKRDPRTLGAIAAFVVAMRLLDAVWTIVPSTLGERSPALHAFDVIVPLAIVTIACGATTRGPSAPDVVRGEEADAIAA